MLENFKKFQVVGEFGVSEAIDWGWRLYTILFGKMALLALVFFLPFHILEQVSAAFLGVSLSLFPADPSVGQVLALIGWQLMWAVLTLLMSMILVLMIKGEIDGEGAGVRDFVNRAWALMGRGLWTGFERGIILFFGFLLFLIPGLIFSVYYSFALYNVAILGMSGFEALNHSHSLVVGRWWRIFGLILLTNIIGLGVTGLADLALGWMGMLGGLAAQIISDLAWCFQVSAMAAIFLNIQVERDWYANRKL